MFLKLIDKQLFTAYLFFRKIFSTIWLFKTLFMSLSLATPPDELPELMLATEVAEYLRIPLPTVYYLGTR